MPKRFCSDCGALFDMDVTNSRRCPVHQAVADERAAARRARATVGRGSASARGYGAVYRRRARVIVRAAVADQVPCAICSEPCLPGQELVAHHPDGRPALADQASCRLVAAHKRCNDGFRPGG